MLNIHSFADVYQTCMHVVCMYSTNYPFTLQEMLTSGHSHQVNTVATWTPPKRPRLKQTQQAQAMRASQTDRMLSEIRFNNLIPPRF